MSELQYQFQYIEVAVYRTKTWCSNPFNVSLWNSYPYLTTYTHSNPLAIFRQNTNSFSMQPKLFPILYVLRLFLQWPRKFYNVLQWIILLILEGPPVHSWGCTKFSIRIKANKIAIGPTLELKLRYVLNSISLSVLIALQTICVGGI